MATTAVDRAVLDTNVLLSATDETRPRHQLALEALNDWPRSGVTLYTSGQILREYLCVATRPITHNGLGLSGGEAVDNVHALRSRLRHLSEEEKVSDRLLELLSAVPCSGKQIHDANLVATMLVHGIDTILTSNTADLSRFDAHVRVLDL